MTLVISTLAHATIPVTHASDHLLWSAIIARPRHTRTTWANVCALMISRRMVVQSTQEDVTPIVILKTITTAQVQTQDTVTPIIVALTQPIPSFVQQTTLVRTVRSILVPAQILYAMFVNGNTIIVIMIVVLIPQPLMSKSASSASHILSIQHQPMHANARLATPRKATNALSKIVKKMCTTPALTLLPVTSRHTTALTVALTQPLKMMVDVFVKSFGQEKTARFILVHAIRAVRPAQRQQLALLVSRVKLETRL